MHLEIRKRLSVDGGEAKKEAEAMIAADLRRIQRY